MDEITEKGMGWFPDLPDRRDLTLELEKKKNDGIKDMVKELGIKEPVTGIPDNMDLRQWCSPVEDQKSLGSCTANAGVGLLEYFERRAFGNHIDASRLFLYKNSRKLAGLTGDTGSYLRTTMAALVLFGVPPEKYWQYTDKKPDFDADPDSFCYAFAENYKTIQYLRLDPPSTPVNILLDRIKANLAAGLPSMFGFTVYDSIYQAEAGNIPYPCSGEKVAGGHAVVAVGYDDSVLIENSKCGKTSRGALLIRNSWGTSWGDKGYGWLPYDYVLKGLAADWWTLIKADWVATGEFGL